MPEQSGSDGPTFSVVMPVFNAEQYLQEAVSSVAEQEYQSWELLCVDDGSTDATAVILDRLAADDPRIRVMRQQNSGQAAARNAALRAARGDRLVFLDADDRLHGDALAVLAEAAAMSEPDVVVYGYQVIDARGAVIDGPRVPPASSSKTDDVDKRLMLLNELGVVWSKCVRRSYWQDQRLLFPEGRIFEDELIHWMLLVEAPAVVSLDKVLYHYRSHSGTTTQRRDIKRMDRIDVYDRIAEYLSTSDAKSREYSAFFAWQQLRMGVDVHDNVPRRARANVRAMMGERLGASHHQAIAEVGDADWRTTSLYTSFRSHPSCVLRRRLWLAARDGRQTVRTAMRRSS